MHHGWWSHENRQTDTYEYINFPQICCQAGNKTRLLSVNDYIVDLHLLKQRPFPYIIIVNFTCAKYRTFGSYDLVFRITSHSNSIRKISFETQKNGQISFIDSTAEVTTNYHLIEPHFTPVWSAVIKRWPPYVSLNGNRFDKTLYFLWNGHFLVSICLLIWWPFTVCFNHQKLLLIASQ